jgi:cobalt-zinc-cadmium efflux system protein
MSDHHKHSSDAGAGLRLGFFINTAFVVVEFVAGLFSNSLALISDSVHNLTDSFSILLSFFANRISKREATSNQTFGYGRAAILAATINAALLLVTSGFIFRESYDRLMHPQPVSGGVVAIIAIIGILSNGAVAFAVSRNRHELNSRAVFVSNMMDTLSSLGALVAGLIIIVTKQTWADPLISFFIGVMLLYAAWEIMREASNVLLEGVPKGIDAIKVKQAILESKHIRDLDDLHIWTMGAGEAALSCHIVIDDCSVSESVKLVSNIKGMLAKEFQITHATIETQIESGPHDNERADEGLTSHHK